MGLFTRKKIKAPQDPRLQYQTANAKTLSDLITSYLPQYKVGQPYTGERVAPLSGFEDTGLSQFQDLINNPDFQNIYGAGSNVLQGTLEGSYDPFTSPYYQSLRNEADFLGQDTMDAIRRNAGARGKYFSSALPQEISRFQERFANQRLGLLGGIQQQERTNQLNALNQVGAYTQVPYQRIASILGIGSLPRSVEQAQNEADYQDFLRQQEEFANLAGVAQGAAGTARFNETADTYQPSLFEQITPFISSLFKR